MPVLRRSQGPEISYTDTGGDGPVLVFSHGILMDASMFDAQVEACAPAYRCVTWDQRGHGSTGLAHEAFTFWDSAGDLIAILDDLAVPRAVLIGMSQGGFVSLRAALTAPDRVRGLVLIDSQAGLEAEDAGPLYRELAENWARDGYDPAVAAFVAQLILGPADHDPWMAKWAAYPQQQVYEPVMTLLARDDITSRLPEIAAPALVIHGEADAAIPIDRAEALAAGLPACRGLVRVPDGGHASNVSHPEHVNKAILSFLDQLETAG